MSEQGRDSSANNRGGGEPGEELWNPRNSTAPPAVTTNEEAALFSQCGYSAQELQDAWQAEQDVLGSSSLAAATAATLQIYDTTTAEAAEEEEGEHPTLQTARQGLQDALATIPPEQREALDYALAQDPRVVHLESPWERYLLKTQHNYWSAAQLLCHYWTQRKIALGPEHYALPLRLTEPSALPPAVIQAIRSGVMIVLPTPDAFGRPVVLYDRQRTTALLQEANTRMLLTYYALQVVSESSLGILNGYVCVTAGETMLVEQKMEPANFFPFLQQALPLEIKAVHVVQMTAPQTTQLIWQRAMQTMLHGAQQIGVLRLRLRLHTVTTPEQARAEVAPFGLTSQHHLPARLGGTALTPEAWLAQRLQLEHSRYAFLENPPTTTTLVVPPPPQENPTTPTINWQELREWSEERAEQKALQKLQQQHESLRQQEALLQAQITCANSVAQQYESDHQKIQDYLQTFLEASVVTTTDGPAALATAAQEILQHLLFFRGRNAVTGQFMFESQTAGQDEAVVQQIALLEQALPLLTCTILKQHEERSSTTTSTITRTGIIISDHEEEEEDPVDFVPADDSLDRTIQALQQQLADLQSKQDSLSKQQDFLQASQVCAQDTAQGFDTYQQETLPRLKKSIVTLLTSLSQNLAALDPTPVAQRILSKVLWFGGSEPPPVTAETLSLGLETSLAVAPETTLDQKAPSQNPKQMEANTTRTNTSKPVGEIVWRSDRCLTKECKNVKNVCIVDENRI